MCPPLLWSPHTGVRWGSLLPDQIVCISSRKQTLFFVNGVYARQIYESRILSRHMHLDSGLCRNPSLNSCTSWTQVGASAPSIFRDTARRSTGVVRRARMAPLQRSSEFTWDSKVDALMASVIGGEGGSIEHLYTPSPLSWEFYISLCGRITWSTHDHRVRFLRCYACYNYRQSVWGTFLGHLVSIYS